MAEEERHDSSDSTMVGPMTPTSDLDQRDMGQSSLPRKRQRKDMLQFKSTLDNLWDRGMTNYSTEEAKQLLDQAVLLTGQTPKDIKNWIDNKKKTVRASNTHERTKPKQKVSKRRKSSFSCFLSDKLKGPATTATNKDRLQEIHEEWKHLDAESKQQYEERASQAKFVTIDDLTDDEKKRQATALLKDLDRLTEKFQNCGLEMAVMLYNPHWTGVAHAGTPKGVQFLTTKEDELNFQFAKAMSDGKSTTTNTITTKELTQQVRQVLNEKYAAASKKPTNFPYSQYAAGKVRVDGLPDNVSIAHLASLGKKSLQSILEVKDRITIEASTSTSSTATTTTAPSTTTTTASPSTVLPSPATSTTTSTATASPSATDLLLSIEKGNVIPVPGDEGDRKAKGMAKGNGKTKGKREAKEKAQDSEEDLYIVEKLVKRRTRRGREEYLVKWEGYPTEQNSWEPVENIPLAIREMFDQL